MTETNYCSGEDYEVEFLAYRFQFNRRDFEERVIAAAVKLGLLDRNELDEDETSDLVELAADGRIESPRSPLGWYLVRHWERVSLVDGESLVYWLRKLVFRSAWLDHRVKEGRLEVAWDDDASDFAYRDPQGDRALLELAPVPSWHELQFRRRRLSRRRAPALGRDEAEGRVLLARAEPEAGDRADRDHDLLRLGVRAA